MKVASLAGPVALAPQLPSSRGGSTGALDGLAAGASSSSPANGVQTGRSRGIDVHGIQGGRLLALLVFVGLSLLSYKYVHSGELAHFVLKIQENPLGSLHLFVLFHTFAVVLLFPVMILQTITGALYGLYAGLVVSWLASSVGQALAFLLGRYLFRASVKSYLLQRVPNFPQIEAAIKKEGWKLMCLLRLSPILPYNILNYAAALTPISFFAYTLSSAAAIIPWTILYVYLGTLSTRALAELARGKLVTHVPNGEGAHEGSNVRVMLSSAIYMAALAATIVYGYVLSKRAITSVLKSVSDTGQGSGPGPGGAGDVELAGTVVKA